MATPLSGILRSDDSQQKHPRGLLSRLPGAEQGLREPGLVVEGALEAPPEEE